MIDPDDPLSLRWPVRLREALRRPVADLVGGAVGRVLDLGNSLDHLEHYRGATGMGELVVVAPGGAREAVMRRALDLGIAVTPSDGPLPSIADGSFDTVVSVVALPFEHDLDATLGHVARVLVPGGRLLFVEPVAPVSAVGRLLGFTAALGRATAGLELGREVPAVARRAGLTVTDVERITMPTSIPPLRRFVAARAVKLVGADDSGDPRSIDPQELAR